MFLKKYAILIISYVTSVCFLFYCFYFSAEISCFSDEILIHWKHVLFDFIGYCYNNSFNVFIFEFQYLVHLQIRHNSFSLLLRMHSIFLDFVKLNDLGFILDVMDANSPYILLFPLIVLFSWF